MRRLRGTRVGGASLRGFPRFANRWLVMAGGRPVFMRSSSPKAEPLVELGTPKPRNVLAEGFHHTLDLE